MFDSPSPGKDTPRYLQVPLKQFTPHWPRTVREILAVHPVELTLAIPMDELGEALRHGKVKFPWKQLRGWINPPINPDETIQGDLRLELPLPVVVPLAAALYGTDDNGSEP